jgi:hypothetical protein
MPRFEPVFTSRQAERCRRAFRGWRSFFRATNAKVGEALDAHPALRGRWSEGEGPKAVANSMVTGRKLTHRMARRLIVGLLLTDAARGSERAPGKELARCLFDVERKVLGDATALLVELGALPGERMYAVPAFVPPDAIAPLARDLAADASRIVGIGARTRDRLRRAMCASLRSSAPAMARAWCDGVQTKLMQNAEMTHLIEDLAEATFGTDYIHPAQMPAWGPEFAVLDRERPLLMQFIEIPVL